VSLGKTIRSLLGFGKHGFNRALVARLKGERKGITPEHVTWAYRLFLDRDPESEATVSANLRAWHTTRELRTSLMTSAEFRAKNPDLAYTNERNVVIKELENNTRLFIDLSDQVIGLGIVRGRYEQSEVEFVRRTVKPGQVVLDIGANIGFFTVTLATLVGPSGRVYAFEPLDHVADLLERSIHENQFQDRVILERAAVGQTASSGKLVFVRETLNSGGAYLDTRGAGAPSGHELKEVPVVCLDSYPLQRPVSFIKVDVEGAELLALRGARTVLETDRPAILSEINPVQLERVSGCSPDQFVSEIEEYGYHCHLLDHGSLTRKLPSPKSLDVVSVVFLPK